MIIMKSWISVLMLSPLYFELNIVKRLLLIKQLMSMYQL